MGRKESILKTIRGHSYTYQQRSDLISICANQDWNVQHRAHYDRTQVPDPVDLCIEVTRYCNFTCENCFSSSISGKIAPHLDMLTISTTIRRLRDEIVRVCITGGEPLLHPNAQELIELAETERSLGFVLSTNGSVSTPLYDLIQRTDILVAVSLHGKESAHNAYTKSTSHSKVLRRIEELARTNAVHIYSVVNNRMTPEDVEWLVSFRRNCGADLLRFIEPRDFGRYVPSTVDAVRAAVISASDIDTGVVYKVSPSKTLFLSALGEMRRTN